MLAGVRGRGSEPDQGGSQSGAGLHGHARRLVLITDSSDAAVLTGQDTKL